MTERFELASFSLSAMVKLGAELRALGRGATSMEEITERAVHLFHDRLIDEDGRPAFPLVRLFQTRLYRDLEPAAQAIARDRLGSVPPPTSRCLILVATTGSEPEWRSPDRSRAHLCIPLPSSGRIAELPMIQHLLHQLGVDLSAFDDETPRPLIDLVHQNAHNVFYVPDAAGNPCIPDQESFVARFGIRSVIGFGGTLPGNQMFALIAFARSRISRDIAALFGPLSLSTALAVAPFHPSAAAADEDTWKPRALERLLEVIEHTVVEQAHRMEQVQAELGRLARVDSLTGLPNRRAFDERLTADWGRAVRHGQSLSLLLIDVDRFKHYNDAFGHPAGDSCLRAIAAALASCARRSADLVARFGGEEFAVLLPDTDLDTAAALAEAMRLRVASDVTRPSPAGAAVTISVGVASLAPDQSTRMAALIDIADGALYSAKNGGRNRVCVGTVP